MQSAVGPGPLMGSRRQQGGSLSPKSTRLYVPVDILSGICVFMSVCICQSVYSLTVCVCMFKDTVSVTVEGMGTEKPLKRVIIC